MNLNQDADAGLLIDTDRLKNLDWDLLNVKIESKEHWHKFIVSTGSIYDKVLVLNTILEAISPVDLVPVKYSWEGKNSVFLARNCGAAIRTLCDMNLVLPCASNNPRYITVSILVCFSHIDSFKIVMFDVIRNVIQKRYNSIAKYLDLSQFYNDSDFGDLIYCPLHLNKFLKYVLSAVQFENVEIINLSNNNLTEIEALKDLEKFRHVKVLDISNNELNFISDLNPLSTVDTIKELVLLNNPLCDDVTDCKEYLVSVLKYFPQLVKLDKCFINKQCSLPMLKCFLIDDKLTAFVDQFLSLYFNYYDNDRSQLCGFYHKQAQFSFTADVQLHTKNSNNLQWMTRSRNILQWSRSCNLRNILLKNGSDEIMKCFCDELDTTEHDPSSFHIDLTLNNNTMTVLNVCGVFKDGNIGLKHFDRTFILTLISEDHYEIVNDMLHVTNCDKYQLEESFKSNLTTTLPDDYKMPTYTNEEKSVMIQVMSKITSINELLSAKCLSDSDWNMANALKTYVELFKNQKIPSEVFSKHELND